MIESRFDSYKSKGILFFANSLKKRASDFPYSTSVNSYKTCSKKEEKILSDRRKIALAEKKKYFEKISHTRFCRLYVKLATCTLQI